MCGRFTLASPAETLDGDFGPFDAGQDPEDVPELAPRFNIAPTQPVATVRATTEGRRALELRRWGLVPHFSREASGAPLFNARAETVAAKPSFRDAFQKRRCLIPADGFYEWFRVAERRQPFYVRRKDGRAFAMAGLFEHWEAEGADPIDSCTIVTTEANALLAPIHDRMPVILSKEGVDAWLDAQTHEPHALDPWLVPAPAEDFCKFPVDPRVNRWSWDDPSSVEPLFEGLQ